MAGPGKTGRPGPAQTIEVRLAHAEIVKFARAGLEYEEIAAKTGYAAQTCHNVVRDFLKNVDANVGDLTDVRAMEIARLDRIIERLWPLLDPDDPDVRPNLKAISEYRATAKDRRDILGLGNPDANSNAGVNLNVSLHAELSSVEVTQRFRQLSQLVLGTGDPDDDIQDAEIVENDENTENDAKNAEISPKYLGGVANGRKSAKNAVFEPE